MSYDRFEDFLEGIADEDRYLIGTKKLGKNRLQKKYGVRINWARRAIKKLRAKDEVEASKLEVRRTQNSVSIESVSRERRTVEEVIAAAELDPEDWIIDKTEVNVWPTTMRIRNFDENGDIFEEVPVQVDNWQIKIYARKRVIEKQKFPPIAPVIIGVSRYHKPVKEIASQGTALIFGDTQNGYHITPDGVIPSHDRSFWSLMVQIAKDRRPDQIVLLGDHLDLPDWSEKFLRTPAMRGTTQLAINELHWWLCQLREAAPNAKIVYLEGNHEQRMPRAIISNLMALAGVKQAGSLEEPPTASVPYLLNLKSLDIEWVGNYPAGTYRVSHDLIAVHGFKTSTAPGGSAGALLKDADESMVLGHCHRQEIVSKTVHGAQGVRYVQVATPGAGCMLDGSVPSGSPRNNWQQGALIAEYADGYSTNFRSVLIKDGVTYFDGTEYKSEPRKSIIKRLDKDIRFHDAVRMVPPSF